MNLKQQFKTLFPSIPDALYRHLIREDTLAYLKVGQGITGFEIDFEKTPSLAGLTLIGIKKHSIMAYRHEKKYQLILFPTIPQINDPALRLQGIYVHRNVYTDDSFKTFKPISSGTLKEVSRDLVPPHKEIDLSDKALESLDEAMKRGQTLLNRLEDTNEEVDDYSFDIDNSTTTVDTNTFSDEDFVDDFVDDDFVDDDFVDGSFGDDDFYSDDFDPEMGDVETLSETDEPNSMGDNEAKDPQDEVGEEGDSNSVNSPAHLIQEQSFTLPSEVMDFAVLQGGDRAILINLLNALMQKAPGVPTETLTKAYQKLVVRLFDDHREKG